MNDLRIFREDTPFQVLQNLLTALDPQLLTEHTLMLLFHDLPRLLPLEELPHRFVEVMSEYLATEDDDEPEIPTH